ncbi:hypothetical protein D3C78_1503950 [compost metagenome]
MLQAAAALLVVLGEEVGLFRLFRALEAGDGDVEGLADQIRPGQGEADAEQQRQVHDGRQEQGEAQAIRRAYAGGAREGSVGSCVHRWAHGR